MTDTERERINAICEVAGVTEIDDLSDGFHTFRQLYYQRMILFAVIVGQNKDKAWKSLRHEDGELCFGGGWFIVGIDTPEGSYTYHYENDYYSLFDCEELVRGKHWDGHTEKDVTRLLSLQVATDTNVGDTISRQAALDAVFNNAEHPDKAYQAIRHLSSAQPGWIPCSIALPEHDGEYLVTKKSFGWNCKEYIETDIARYGKKDGWHKADQILAWQPLPTPYREGERDE